MEHAVRSAVWRHSSRDGLLVAFSCAHLALILTAPSIPVVAIGLWWNANTVAHNFIHHPFFRSSAANRVYAAWLSAVVGFPLPAWRIRHLAHHAETHMPLRFTPEVTLHTLIVLTVWAIWAALAPVTFVTVYIPGWACGMVLCAMQGHFEHAAGTTSHYGRLYNLLFFNDGYHVEHHLKPGLHWTQLGAWRADGVESRWPPVMRWLDLRALELLERLVLRVPLLQRFVLRVHERAFIQLRPLLGDVRTVLIVGGGLFPRTALVLARVLPGVSLAIVEAQPQHLAIARDRLKGVELRVGTYGGEPVGADAVVVPLSYTGDRRALYESPPARVTLVHDWIWTRRGRSVMVSPLLLKRLNAVTRTCDSTLPSPRRA